MGKRHIALDPYIVDTLMRDLVGHDRSASSFLVFLYLWSETSCGTRAFAASYQSIASSTGLSRRTVQDAVAQLGRRGLVSVARAYATALPEYRVRKVWRARRVPARPAAG